MSTATPTSNGRPAPHSARPAAAPLARRSTRVLDAVESLDLSYVFADTVVRYLLAILPQVGRELAHWHARAAAIPDPTLRRSARQALGKRGNIEGAALFAALAPAAHRPVTVRALVAFQSAYNYLDALGELPSEDPLTNGEQLHQALLVALHPEAPHRDYYRHNAHSDDGGYLVEIVARCREAFGALPSFQAVAPIARAAASRIVDFQVLNLSESHGGHDALERWAIEVTPPASGLHWWETAAGAGSSLAVHALIAAAADPHLEVRDARQLDGAYFPWAGSLHSLLDSLVDRIEDHEQGQPSLLDYYRSSTDAAIRLSRLAQRTRGLILALPNRHAHRVIVTAMCSYYLSAPQCDTDEARTVTRALTAAMGPALDVAILMFRCRRLVRALSRRSYT